MKSIRIVGIPIISLGLFFMAVFGLVGFIIAIPTALGVGVQTGQEQNNVLTTLTFGIISGGAVLIMVPLIYGLIGIIHGIVTAIILNIFLKFAGGLEIEVKES